MIQCSVWLPRRTDCDGRKLQLIDRMGADCCWHGWFLPLRVRAGNHADSNGKASDHYANPKGSPKTRLGGGNVPQPVDCWVFQKLWENGKGHPFKWETRDLDLNSNLPCALTFCHWPIQALHERRIIVTDVSLLEMFNMFFPLWPLNITSRLQVDLLNRKQPILQQQGLI